MNNLPFYYLIVCNTAQIYSNSKTKELLTNFLQAAPNKQCKAYNSSYEKALEQLFVSFAQSPNKLSQCGHPKLLDTACFLVFSIQAQNMHLLCQHRTTSKQPFAVSLAYIWDCLLLISLWNFHVDAAVAVAVAVADSPKIKASAIQLQCSSSSRASRQPAAEQRKPITHTSTFSRPVSASAYVSQCVCVCTSEKKNILGF